MQASPGFLDHPWRLSYRTAARRPDGQPVDILRPIRIGPGLLVYLDRFKQTRFLHRWQQLLTFP